MGASLQTKDKGALITGASAEIGSASPDCWQPRAAFLCSWEPQRASRTTRALAH